MVRYVQLSILFFFNDTATTEIYTLSLHDALPICTARTRDDEPGEQQQQQDLRQVEELQQPVPARSDVLLGRGGRHDRHRHRSEEHTSELQSRLHLVCRLLLEKKKKKHRKTSRSQR